MLQKHISADRVLKIFSFYFKWTSKTRPWSCWSSRLTSHWSIQFDRNDFPIWRSSPLLHATSTDRPTYRKLAVSWGQSTSQDDWLNSEFNNFKHTNIRSQTIKIPSFFLLFHFILFSISSFFLSFFFDDDFGPKGRRMNIYLKSLLYFLKISTSTNKCLKVIDHLLFHNVSSSSALTPL